MTEKITENRRSYWDTQAAGFDSQPDHGMRDPVLRTAWCDLLSGLFPEPPARVADLGCGTGTVSLLLAGQGYDVTGVDFAPAMIEEAERKARQVEATVDFRVGDASEPPLSPGAFDVVFARHVVWALPDPADALRRWAGLLGEAGRLVLVEGFWSTGAGLTSAELTRLVEPYASITHIHNLADLPLWGGTVTDERYALVADRLSAA